MSVADVKSRYGVAPVIARCSSKRRWLLRIAHRKNRRRCGATGDTISIMMCRSTLRSLSALHLLLCQIRDISNDPVEVDRAKFRFRDRRYEVDYCSSKRLAAGHPNLAGTGICSRPEGRYQHPGISLPTPSGRP
jgi:hypothetical protein